MDACNQVSFYSHIDDNNPEKPESQPHSQQYSTFYNQKSARNDSILDHDFNSNQLKSSLVGDDQAPPSITHLKIIQKNQDILNTLRSGDNNSHRAAGINYRDLPSNFCVPQ